MEVNFSAKVEDDDEIDSKPGDILGGRDFKPDTIDAFDEDLQGPVAGVPDDIKITDKMKILEEGKESVKKQLTGPQKVTPGRSKLQT
jgi:hypothetical protein